MKHVITQVIIGSKKQIDISPEEYDAIQQAKEGVVESISIEEKFDFLMGNYRDLEVGLLNITTDDMLFRDDSWFRKMDERNRVSRMVGNLLSSCRMYLDRLGRHLGCICGKDSVDATKVKEWTAEEYDSKFAYRFMEAHRNYTQHKGDPVHGLSFDWNNHDDADIPGLEFCLHPTINLTILKSDKKFKKSIIEEIITEDAITLDENKSFDLKPLIREYIHSISQVHGKVRVLIESKLKSWEALIENTVKRYRENCESETFPGLAVVKIHPKGNLQGIIPIFDDLVERRRRFLQRNPIIDKRPYCYVSGRLR